MELAAGTVVSGRYCVLEALGRGAMAVVYLVRHEQLGTLHALKVLQLPSWSVQRRLLQEGRIQGALKHPNVVGVTDTVEVDGSPGLVMELVRGPGLDRLLQHGRLPLDVARALGVGVLAGVAAAHREGLIHRDLKPANVLVDAAGPALVPRVTDFGLAKLLGPESQGAVATRSGASLGTPAYMAPEQIRDPRSVDQRSDVFALGALLYELVTGRRAFPGDDLLELFRRIDEGRYTPIGVAAPDAPADLAAAIEAALRPDPRERPQGVPELLDRWTSGRGEAVLADVSWDPELLALARELGRVDAAAATLSPSASHTWDLGASALEPALTPMPPAPRPARRGAPWVWLGSIVAVAALVGVLGVGLFAAGLAAGVIAWVYDAPPISESVERVSAAYTVAGVPPLVGVATPESRRAHEDAWRALLDGEPARAEGEARRVLASNDAVGPRLVLVAALLELGDPSALDELEFAVAQSGRGAGGELASVARQALAERPDRGRIEAYLLRNPDDLLARLLLPAIDGWDREARIAVARQAVAEAGELPGPRLRLARLLLDAGRDPDASAAIEPLGDEHPRVRVLRAELVLRRGDAGPAREQAELALAVDRSQPGAWYVLAGAAALQGVDLEALSPDAGVGVRVAFARGAAEGLFALGRPTEAREWLARGLEVARLGRDVEGVVALTRCEVKLARYLGGPEDLQRALEQASEAAALPELPGAARDRIALQQRLLDGLLALERKDASKVQELLLDLEGLERGDRLADSLRAASLARGGDASGVDAIVGDGCMARSFRARWLTDARDPRGEEAYAAVVSPDSPCGRFGTDRYARAHAHAVLADKMLEAGETDGAEEQLRAFEALLPAPEIGLSAFQDAMVVRESLDVAAQGL